MTTHFLTSYVDLLIATCHRRGIHAMGGMAAQIPIKNNPEANERGPGPRSATTSCAKSGPATTAPGWRIPGLVPVAEHIFDTYMPCPNQWTG